MQTKGSSAEKIIQLCFNPRVRNFPTICEVMKILKQMWNFREVVRLPSWCVITVPRVEAPLQTQHRESVRTPRWTWVCQGRLQKSNDKLFSVSTYIPNTAKKNLPLVEEAVKVYNSHSKSTPIKMKLSGWSRYKDTWNIKSEAVPRIVSTSRWRHKVWNNDLY